MPPRSRRARGRHGPRRAAARAAPTPSPASSTASTTASGTRRTIATSPRRSTAQRLSARASNKAALQARFGLDRRIRTRCCSASSAACRSRRGSTSCSAPCRTLLAPGGQLALLGAGDRDLEDGFRGAAAAPSGPIGAVLGYDEALGAPDPGRRGRAAGAVPLRALRPDAALRAALRRGSGRRAGRRPGRHGHRRQRGGACGGRRDRHPVRAGDGRHAAGGRSGGPRRSLRTSRHGRACRGTA